MTYANEVVAKYPANSPVRTEVISRYVSLTLNLKNEKNRSEATKTQPTCGLELNVHKIEKAIKNANKRSLPRFSL